VLPFVHTGGFIDAIIDLAIPVTAAYEDIIGELELDVLTDPRRNEAKLHSTSIYGQEEQAEREEERRKRVTEMFAPRCSP